MILTSLRAENVLKYESLTSTPAARGVVAISGLQRVRQEHDRRDDLLALFGRTFSLDDAHIAKIVRWGENRCSVSATFRVGHRLPPDPTLDTTATTARPPFAPGRTRPTPRARAGGRPPPPSRSGSATTSTSYRVLLSRAARDHDAAPAQRRRSRSWRASRRSSASPASSGSEIEASAGGHRRRQVEDRGIDGDLATSRSTRAPAAAPRGTARRGRRGGGHPRRPHPRARGRQGPRTRRPPAIKAAKRSFGTSGPARLFCCSLVTAVSARLGGRDLRARPHFTQQLVKRRPDTRLCRTGGRIRRPTCAGCPCGGGRRRAVPRLPRARGVFGARLRQAAQTCSELADALLSVHPDASQLDAANGGGDEAPPVTAREPTLARSRGAARRGRGVAVGGRAADDDEVQRVARLIGADECSEVQARACWPASCLGHSPVNERTTSLPAWAWRSTSSGPPVHAATSSTRCAATWRARSTRTSRRIGCATARSACSTAPRRQISHPLHRRRPQPGRQDAAAVHRWPLRGTADRQQPQRAGVLGGQARLHGPGRISSGTQRQIMLELRLALSQACSNRTCERASSSCSSTSRSRSSTRPHGAAPSRAARLSTDLQQIFIVAQGLPGAKLPRQARTPCTSSARRARTRWWLTRSGDGVGAASRPRWGEPARHGRSGLQAAMTGGCAPPCAGCPAAIV